MHTCVFKIPKRLINAILDAERKNSFTDSMKVDSRSRLTGDATDNL